VRVIPPAQFSQRGRELGYFAIVTAAHYLSSAHVLKEKLFTKSVIPSMEKSRLI